jgi:steroid 5-alpha reductase family enzyme
MDKLWSILPEVYLWVIAIRSGLNLRVLVMAIIATLWGIRLTFNFGRKGAYRLKFWEGEEDYRWAYLRENTILKNRVLFVFFDLFFISIYQNVLILATCLPGVAVMESSVPFGGMDFVASGLMVFFLALETISDEQQWKFQSTKYKLLGEGKTLSELPEPYSLGFNTKGVWAFMRHPNYLGEQGVWVSLYLFTVQAGVNTYGIFNWSIVGCMFLILLFLGSSTFGESISSGKYPQYKDYQSKVFKYLPFRKY